MAAQAAKQADALARMEAAVRAGLDALYAKIRADIPTAVGAYTPHPRLHFCVGEC
jgi:hypothetical protein